MKPRPSQWKHDTSTSTLGSVKGKKCGRRRTSRRSPKVGAGELQQRPLEVGEGDVLVHRQALDLVELGRVGGVVVGPVDASGDDHVQRRRVGLHRPHLHRRGVGPQHELLGHVEGVGARPGGMGGAVVEGVEVVVDGLDLGAFHDREAEPEEDVFQLAAGAA